MHPYNGTKHLTDVTTLLFGQAGSDKKNYSTEYLSVIPLRGRKS